MTITVQATYENGVLKPAQPLPLNEREQVQVTIRRPTSGADRTYGMIGWKGSHEELEQILAEAEEQENLP
jgi:predicted DNA-binding antitoxin AbrB/MazE fold protein